MVNTNESFKEYFTEPAELTDTRKRLAELLLKAAIPRWLLPSDAGGEMWRAIDADYKRMVELTGVPSYEPSVEIPLLCAAPGYNLVAHFDDDRVCYHCDSRAGVSGVVPLCAGCRGDTR